MRRTACRTGKNSAGRGGHLLTGTINLRVEEGREQRDAKGACDLLN